MKRMILLFSILVFIQLLAFQIQEAHSSASYKLVATIPVGGSLVDIAVADEMNEIYVTNFGNNEVNVIDGTIRRIKTSIPVVAPARMTIDWERRNLLVTSTQKGMTIFDLPVRKALKTIDRFQGGGGAIVPSINRLSNKVYLVYTVDSRIEVIDALSYEFIKEILLEHRSAPQSLAINPTLNEIYVSTLSSNRAIVVIDGSREIVSLSIPIGAFIRDNIRGIAFNDITNEVYVGHDDGVSIIDVSPVVGPSTYKVVKTIALQGYPVSIAVNKLRNEIYVLLQRTNAVAVIDIPTRKLVTTIPLELSSGTPWAIDVDENRGLIYTTGDGTVKVISVTEEPTEPTTPSQPSVPKTTSRFLYSMSLSKGLNMVSLPVKLDSPLTARKFAEMTGATLIVRFNKKLQKFEAWVPEVATSDGFEIEGGQGYIINALQEKTVNFVGTGWGTPLPASPPLNPLTPSIPTSKIWAFVIAGILSDDLASKAHRLIIRNLRNGMTVESYVENGGFAIPFVDMSRNSVVEDGNVFEIRIVDLTGNVLGTLTYQVSIHDLIMGKLIVKPVISDLVPTTTKLYQNYPNPFNPETWIPYQLSEDADVVIQIYDSTGRLVRTLNIGQQSAGIYVSKERASYWDGKNEMGEVVASGVYYYSIRANGFRSVRRMILLK